MITNIKGRFIGFSDEYVARFFHYEKRITKDDIIFASFDKSGRTWVRFFVASYINDFYNKNKECWMMYGSSKWTDNRPCCAREYTEEEFKNLRKAPFKISHIRTFRAGLYANVAEQDFDFNCMKDKNGEWYKMTYDVAMFLPMLEMAGKEHVFYNE